MTQNTGFSKFSCACVGLKGLEFLNGLAEREVFPQRVASYRQSEDLASAFDKISAFCDEHSIPLLETRKPAFEVDELVFMVGWQYLLAESGAELIVFHDSLLPSYRGFAPTVTALINGEERIGVSALKPVQDVDAGPIVAQGSFEVSHPMKVRQALEKQSRLMLGLAVEILETRAGGELKAKEQDHTKATFSIWRDREDYWLDWSLSAQRLARTVAALGYPYEGARASYKGQTIYIHDAHAVADLIFEIRQPGKIWQLSGDGPVVVCGEGLLLLTDVRDDKGEQIEFRSLRARLGAPGPAG